MISRLLHTLKKSIPLLLGSQKFEYKYNKIPILNNIGYINSKCFASLSHILSRVSFPLSSRTILKKPLSEYSL